MKILFINPFFNYRGHDKFPIALGYLTAISKDFGRIFISDESIGERSEEKIKSVEPDVICITSTTPSFDRAVEIMRFAKEFANEIDKETKIIVGGVHATFQPNDALQYADIVVRGEGEITLTEILEGKDLKEIKGISFKHDGKIVHNKERELIENIDAIPFPAYDFFNLKKYDMMSMITSRGCTFNCSYCCATRFWRCKVRFRSVENVLDELELIQNLGFKKIKIHDSTFTLDLERVKKICNGIVKRKIDLRWSCETRPDKLNEETLDLMKKSGCVLICMGVDSASNEVLKKNKRFVNLYQAKKVFEYAKKIGIRTRAYIVFGLEGETKKSVEETIKFLREVMPDQIMLSLATAYPGTELYNEKTFVNFDYSWVAKFEGHGKGAKLYLPKTLKKDEYKELADYLWRAIKEMKRA